MLLKLFFVIILPLIVIGAAYYWRNELDETIVQQRRVIENFRNYEQVDDVDFLRSLDHPELFAEEGGS